MPHFEEALEWVKIQITSKNTQRFYTPKRVKSYLFPTAFFFCQKCQLISHKEGKAKRREKRSARSRPVKQAFFLQDKIINRTISQDICSLFAHYWYSTSCGWIITVQIVLIRWSVRPRIITHPASRKNYLTRDLYYACVTHAWVMVHFIPWHPHISMHILHTFLCTLLWYWQGEFVKQSRASLVGDHFLYSRDLNVWFRADKVRRN